MIEENINKICVSGNQATYSLTRIPSESISSVYAKQFGGDFAVFVQSLAAEIDRKRGILIDCSGQEYEPDQLSSSIILTGSNEALSHRVSDTIREKLGIQ
ncbi:MAG: hypothetical protein ACK4VI_10040 [Alphaproteobacteria bacterium]